MKFNENYQALARRLMEERRQQLQALEALTEHDKQQADELSFWLESKHARPCCECSGVGMVRFAYTGIVGQDSFIVGRADEDQAGHMACPQHGSFPTLKAAQEAADRLNEANGLDKKAAYRIVTSSIRAQNILEREGA